MKPLLSSDKLVCAHQGVVQLQSVKGKELEIAGESVITESDLKNAVISGCSHNIAGIPKPCTKIVQIPPNALRIMTDNGVPLQLQVQQEKPLELSK